MSVVADAIGKRRSVKRSSSATRVLADLNLPARQSSKRLSLQTALAARKSAPRQFGQRAADELKEALAACQDIEMDAEIQANHMLKYQELKFKSNYPKLSEVLLDAENRMPSRLNKQYVFSGYADLREAAQRKASNADLVDVAQLVQSDKGAANSIRKAVQPLTQAAKQRSSSACALLESPEREESNYLMFRKRQLPKRDKVSDGNRWQKDLRPDVIVPPRPPLPCDCGFHLHLAS